MGPSDAYIVRYLLQNTVAAHQPILWREKEAGEYVATVNGVPLELSCAHSATGSRWQITLLRDLARVCVEEPANIGFLGERYKTAEQRELAQLVQNLASAVARQCQAIQAQRCKAKDGIKEMIYRQLLFQESKVEPRP